MIVINGYLYLDLREPNGQGVGNGAAYPYAHVYWNVAYDPEVRDQLLQGASPTLIDRRWATET